MYMVQRADRNDEEKIANMMEKSNEKRPLHKLFGRMQLSTLLEVSNMAMIVREKGQVYAFATFDDSPSLKLEITSEEMMTYITKVYVKDDLDMRVRMISNIFRC